VLKKKMKPAGRIVLTIFLVLLGVAIVGTLIAWLVSSGENFRSQEAVPGMEYKVGTRSYTVPKLPLKSKAYMLTEKFLEAQRELMLTMNRMMNE